MPEENASADHSAALADTGSTDTGFAGSMAALDAYFTEEQAPESAQVENSDEGTIAESAPTDEPAAEEEKPAGATDETTPPAEEDPESTEAAADATDETVEANFDALGGNPEFLDAEGLKAKFPRNSSKELIETAAGYAEAAKTGHELKASLGGENFIPGVQQIATGLQKGDAVPIFEGIAATTGTDGLLSVFGSVFELGVIRADQFEEVPETQAFGKALNEMVNGIIQKRFGSHVSLATIGRMAELAEAGWLEKIDAWGANEWVDYDEANELLKTSNDPKARAERTEKARRQAQLDEDNAQAEAAARQQEYEVEVKFDQTVNDQITKSLETVWATSPLRDIAGDTPEVAAEKALLRNVLKNQAIDAFKANTEARKKLLTNYKHGKESTAVYREDLVNEITTAVLSTKPTTITSERILARLYGSTRNGQLAAKQAAKTIQPEKEPTVPQKDPAETRQPKKEMTTRDIDQGLTQAFEQFG